MEVFLFLMVKTTQTYTHTYIQVYIMKKFNCSPNPSSIKQKNYNKKGWYAC